MNYEHPCPRVSGYYKGCDIMRVNITEFRVYYRLVESQEVKFQMTLHAHISWLHQSIFFLSFDLLLL